MKICTNAYADQAVISVSLAEILEISIFVTGRRVEDLSLFLEIQSVVLC